MGQLFITEDAMATAARLMAKLPNGGAYVDCDRPGVDVAYQIWAYAREIGLVVIMKGNPTYLEFRFRRDDLKDDTKLDLAAEQITEYFRLN